MPKKEFMQICSIGVLSAFASADVSRGDATVSLQAVEQNGQSITPTNEIFVLPGDVITAEIKIFGWGDPPFDTPQNTGRLRSLEARIAGEDGIQGILGGFHGYDGMIVPVGWDAPFTPLSCPCVNVDYPICDSYLGCVGPDHQPDLMASVDATRADFVFSGLASQNAVMTDSLNIKWGGVIVENEGQIDDGSIAYAGTLNIRVGTLACDRYTFNVVEDVGVTFSAILRSSQSLGYRKCRG